MIFLMPVEDAILRCCPSSKLARVAIAGAKVEGVGRVRRSADLAVWEAKHLVAKPRAVGLGRRAIDVAERSAAAGEEVAGFIAAEEKIVS